MTGAPLNIGHRGACGEAPENTLASFQLAIEQGAEMIELDVRLTRDGVPVVIHDYPLNRTTNGRGLVGLSKWDRLQKLDAGAWFGSQFAGQKLMELGDCLEQITPHVPVNVEIKCFFGRPDKLVRATAEAIRKSGSQERVLVTSFNHKAVELFHQLMPEVAVGRLLHPLFTGGVKLRDFDWLQQGQRAPNQLPFEGRVLAVEVSMANPKMSEVTHARGGVVLVYTVNEEKEMRRMMGYGVDGIITNFPARYRSLLARE